MLVFAVSVVCPRTKVAGWVFVIGKLLQPRTRALLLSATSNWFPTTATAFARFMLEAPTAPPLEVKLG
ncbi:MAG: hypothetical protein FD129_3410 [bacterium]|nr:MAG: hypothetical protein FD129_3410 [bacterium]